MEKMMLENPSVLYKRLVENAGPDGSLGDIIAELDIEAKTFFERFREHNADEKQYKMLFHMASSELYAYRAAQANVDGEDQKTVHDYLITANAHFEKLFDVYQS